MAKITCRSLRWVKLTLLAAVPVSLLLLLLLRRHQYMSTPQYAFHEFRMAMANGDLAQLAQYTSPRFFAVERWRMEVRQHEAKKRGLPLNALNWHAEQRKNNDLQRFGVRWLYRDKTRVEAIGGGLMPPTPHGIISKFIGIKYVYLLVLTNQGWGCDNEETSNIL